ncbi:hypothetical protein LSPH26S_03828 [Lysinibacillus sphaericus]
MIAEERAQRIPAAADAGHPARPADRAEDRHPRARHRRTGNQPRRLAAEDHREAGHRAADREEAGGRAESRQAQGRGADQRRQAARQRQEARRPAVGDGGAAQGRHLPLQFDNFRD